MKATELLTRKWPRRVATALAGVLAGMVVAGCHERRQITYHQPVYVQERPRPVVVVEHGRRPAPPVVIVPDRRDDRDRTIDRDRDDDRRERDDRRDARDRRDDNDRRDAHEGRDGHEGRTHEDRLR